jgi:hypothetical protein
MQIVKDRFGTPFCQFSKDSFTFLVDERLNMVAELKMYAIAIPENRRGDFEKKKRVSYPENLSSTKPEDLSSTKEVQFFIKAFAEIYYPNTLADKGFTIESISVIKT